MRLDERIIGVGTERTDVQAKFKPHAANFIGQPTDAMREVVVYGV